MTLRSTGQLFRGVEPSASRSTKDLLGLTKAGAEQIAQQCVDTFRSIKIPSVRTFDDILLPEDDEHVVQELAHLLDVKSKCAEEKDEKWHSVHMQHMSAKGIPRSAIKVKPEVRDSPWFGSCTPRQKEIDARISH